MKRKFVWKRVVILAAALLAICLLGVAGLFLFGRPLVSAFRASLWTVDPQQSRQAAQAMLDYQLPEGYAETKVLMLQNNAQAVIASDPSQPESMIFFRSVVDGVRQNESWRARYEENWSDDLSSHRYQLRTVEIREMQIDGNSIPIRLMEGEDEAGHGVKLAVGILPGKREDVLVAMMTSIDRWDINQVETFYRSLRAGAEKK